MAGRVQSRNMSRVRDIFRAVCEAADAVCWLCTMPIDYQAPWNDWANDSRFQLDHYWPVSTHPELQEDPANAKASHAGCNRERGNKPPRPGLGIPSQVWFKLAA